MRRERFTYVDLLSERGILRGNTKVVEGCVGSNGAPASVLVADALGSQSSYFMVDLSRTRLALHKFRFRRSYGRRREDGPQLKWVLGAVEEQGSLLKNSVLLFHNTFPTDRKSAGNDIVPIGGMHPVLLRKIIDAGPSIIAFWLPDAIGSREMDRTVQLLGVSRSAITVVAGIYHAEKLNDEEHNGRRGRAIIADLRH